MCEHVCILLSHNTQHFQFPRLHGKQNFLRVSYTLVEIGTLKKIQRDIISKIVQGTLYHGFTLTDRKIILLCSRWNIMRDNDSWKNIKPIQKCLYYTEREFS